MPLFGAVSDPYQQYVLLVLSHTVGRDNFNEEDQWNLGRGSLSTSPEVFDNGYANEIIANGKGGKGGKGGGLQVTGSCFATTFVLGVVGVICSRLAVTKGG